MEDSFICLKSIDKEYSIYDAYDDSEMIYFYNEVSNHNMLIVRNL